MKKIICAFLSVIMVLALFVPILAVSAESGATDTTATSVDGDEIRVMSLNVRVSQSSSSNPEYLSLKWVVGEDESGNLILRVDSAIEQILEINADVICFQEFLFEGSSDVDTKLETALAQNGYGVIWRYLSDGTTQNQTPIFYKTAKFTQVDSGSHLFTYQIPTPVTTNRTIHVQVVKEVGSNQHGQTKNTVGGAEVKEIFGSAGTTTFTDEQIASGDYLDVTNFSAAQFAAVEFNEDGTVTYDGADYTGAYHDRKFITAREATPTGDSYKSLTWAVLQHTNGRELLVMSAHNSVWVSNHGKKADDYDYALVREWRIENVKELQTVANDVYGEHGHMPTIVAGDFNATNDQGSYALLAETFDDVARLAPDAIYWEATSHSPEVNRVEVDYNGETLYDLYTNFARTSPKYPVDHIFCSQGDFEVTSYEVRNDTVEQCLLSDHMALVTELILPTVATPACSHKSAIYRTEQTVTLTSGNTVYYTLDGTDPTTSATRKEYNGAFQVYGDVQLRAVAEKDGTYSPERTVNFATGAELIITEFIKNNQNFKIQNIDGTDENAPHELFSGFEVVNTSQHTLDLGRYNFWHYTASGGLSADTSSLTDPTHSETEKHLFVDKLNTYILEPGQTAFIWIVNADCYSYNLYTSDSTTGFAVTLDAETGLVTYNTDVIENAFEYSTGSTVDVDLIVPLDITLGSYACQRSWSTSDWAVSATSETPTERVDSKNGYHLRTRAFNSQTGDVSLLLVTYNHEITAANAFTTALIANPDGYKVGGSFQGSFYVTNTLDAVSGKVTGDATSFTQYGYGIGTLETAEQTLADNLVRDLSMRKVTWIVDGEESVTYVLRNAVPTTTAPSKANFTFAGWSPVPAACEADSTGTYLLATEATYVAQFYSTANTILATFYDGANNTVDVEGVTTAGDAITLPAAPAGEGTFTGWKDASGKLYAAGASYALTANTTFTPMFVDFTTTKGASIRTNTGSTGIRFLSTLAQADYNALAGLATKVEYGTIIVPQSYVDKAGAFDIDLFSKFLKIGADGWYSTTDSDYVIAGSIANIKAKNYLLDYTACAFLIITYEDGAKVLVYAEREENRGYTVYDTAYNAYNDRTLATDSTHVNEIDVTGIGTTYSPYTSAELTTIRTFMDPVLNLGVRDGKLVSIADTDYYTAALSIPEAWVYNDALNRFEITADSAAAWSTVYACYMENEVVSITATDAVLYIQCNGDYIYSDFY